GFFFQAEDGIRDWSVTGVQTCALPIWFCAPPSAARALRAHPRISGALGSRPPASGSRRASRRPTVSAVHRAPTADRAHNPEEDRSEERRVGKEGRGRGER